ncbi:MAG TPA: sugar phosphate nucleotidyltransferase [Gemmatimonadaceae bacterium]|nr:sugar phosphate nucleotidyltransferase [Gemmatimonadaceae bacterium]
MTVWAVILAGGVGSRFWPVSTATRPKQLLPLVTAQPLLADTLARMAPLADAAHTLILTNASLVAAVRHVAPAVRAGNVIAEPRPAGTAAALAWAASRIARDDGPDAVMMSVHADWAVGDADRFRATLTDAARLAAAHEALVTVGIVPSRADPGFGYIRPGVPVPVPAGRARDDDWGTAPARRVAEFVEKPDRDRAAAMVREGCLWNSGIFVWRVGDFLAEVMEHCPEVAPALAAHPDDAAAFFQAVRPVSVDVGVMERSDRVLVIPGDFGWDDVGTWAALRRVRQADERQNAVNGSVFPIDSSGNVVHAEGHEVVLFGVSDLVVVTHDNLTLVTTVDRAADLKQLLEALPPRLRDRR